MRAPPSLVPPKSAHVPRGVAGCASHAGGGRRHRRGRRRRCPSCGCGSQGLGAETLLASTPVPRKPSCWRLKPPVPPWPLRLRQCAPRPPCLERRAGALHHAGAQLADQHRAAGAARELRGRAQRIFRSACRAAWRCSAWWPPKRRRRRAIAQPMPIDRGRGDAIDAPLIAPIRLTRRAGRRASRRALAVAGRRRRLGAEPKEWLERMNQALTTRNYVGVFTHMHGGRVETLRIIHRVRGRDVSERLLSLDGSGREFIREGDELTCYFPDKRKVLVERRAPDGPLLGALAGDRRWQLAGLRNPRRRARAAARPQHARRRAAAARRIPLRLPAVDRRRDLHAAQDAALRPVGRGHRADRVLEHRSARAHSRLHVQAAGGRVQLPLAARRAPGRQQRARRRCGKP